MPVLTTFPSLVLVWTSHRQPHFISEKWRFNTILSVWAIAIIITHFTSPGSAEKCRGLEGFVNLALSKWRQFLSTPTPFWFMRVHSVKDPDSNITLWCWVIINEKSKNSFSIDLGSSPSKIESDANLTQIAASWDERGNKNGNEELKRKGRRRNKKKKKERNLGKEGMGRLWWCSVMECHFQIAHWNVWEQKWLLSTVLSPRNPLWTRESEISACYKFHTPPSVLDRKSREMRLKYISNS